MQEGIRKHLSSLRTNKHTIVRIVFFVIFSALVFSSFTNADETGVSDKVNKRVVLNITSILSQLDSIEQCFHTNNTLKARTHYETARKLYKEIEFYTEYHFSFHSKYFINAPLVTKAEFEYNYKTFYPHGFQVIEEILYEPETDSTLHKQYELTLLKQSFIHIKDKAVSKRYKNSTVIDMLRFEIVRIMSLYLNGYDCTINKQNLQEIKSILNGLTYTIGLYTENTVCKANCAKIMDAAHTYLSIHTDYDSFNRLYFITKYLKPLYEELYHLYDSEARNEITHYAIHIRQQKFYDKSWFNTSYFSVVLKDSVLVGKQAELGKLLFFDPALSGNDQRACASCHNPQNAFGGNVDLNVSFGSNEKLKRNTPSLLNSVFQKNFFHDGRSLQLEDQVNDVLANHKEMFSNPATIIYKLKQSPQYKALFRDAFKNSEDSAISYYAVLKAISEYERKLIALNSRFDKYIRGDEKQLSRDEITGYTIFAGKALCGSCHFFPLFNGLTPPFYGDNEFEVIGVPKNKLNKETDADSGRYLITKNKIHLAAFKTPGIRNLDQTTPYMHNGIYTTIDEVIDFYKKGGGAGFGLNIENQTLPFDSLQLTAVETKQLKQFLLSLTDKSFKMSVPLSLPVINIKGLEKRKPGGIY
ncbi:MAG: cytochrome c peroxidase [Bacteroidota bacterium]